mgnify:CR=1 FL=1
MDAPDRLLRVAGDEPLHVLGQPRPVARQAGVTKARAAHGQERILVHCAMTSKRGKTLSFDKETGKSLIEIINKYKQVG